MLLRRVIGDVLRARRQGQHRTLREVSTAANVSLGYLSEIERGQKEASSELLAAICEALGSQLSDVLRDASDSLALSEGLPLSEAGLTGRAVTDATRDEPVLEPAGTAPREPVLEPSGAASREPVLVPAEREPAAPELAASHTASHAAQAHPAATADAQVHAQATHGQTITDGTVSVSVRHDGPFRTTLRAVRTGPGPRTRELARPGA